MPTEHSDLTEIVARGDRRMKRLSVAVVMACLLSVTIPGGAVHAAPKSASLAPVIKAIKKQFAKKSSVRFSVKRRGGPASFTWDMKASGAYRFRASGVYAADTTEITQEPRGTGRSRGISVGRDFYSQAYVRSKDGKYLWKSPSKLGKWSHGRNLSGTIWGEDLINGINPGFLKLGASQGATSTDGGKFEGVKTTLYSGTVTATELGERQAGIFFGTDDVDEMSVSWHGPISWKLWVGPDDLPRRFHAVIRFTRPDDGKTETMTMNIIYRGWGKPVKITAPPEHLITTDW